jgi:hypothetical protein
MQDSAPAHFSRAARDVLSNTCHGRWLGREEHTAWPPRLPNLNPLNFYLWKELKPLVYAAPVDNEETLHHSITDACQAICIYPAISEQMLRSMIKRVEACIGFHGGYFEHSLQIYSFSYNSQIKCFETNVYMNIISCSTKRGTRAENL